MNDKLLAELCDNTYVTPKPSRVKGMGVFAIRNIPLRCRAMFSMAERDDEWTTLTRDQAAHLPDPARLLIQTIACMMPYTISCRCVVSSAWTWYFFESFGHSKYCVHRRRRVL